MHKIATCRRDLVGAVLWAPGFPLMTRCSDRGDAYLEETLLGERDGAPFSWMRFAWSDEQASMRLPE